MALIAAIFVFGLLVFVHELGHFFTAKLTGMRVDEFAIGFGPKLLSRKYGETVYSLRGIPLGGFNNIAGMDPEDEKAGDRGYNAKPIWARMVVILAGSFMNFVLPLVLFFGIFYFSGISTPSTEPVLGTILPGKPAAEAGLMAGDRILRIDGQEIGSWQAFVDAVQQEDGKTLAVEYERGGETKTTQVTPAYDSAEKRAMVGVTSAVHTEMPGLFEAMRLSVEKTLFIMQQMIDALAQMIAGKISADVAGPIGVAHMAGQVAQIGFVPLLNFAAFLSLNLGIINLFPIPALDGGHFVALAVEAMRGKPLSAKAMRYTQTMGFALLLALMVYATKNDIMRLLIGS